MAIRKLPSLLVSQIAAGEVIERPASVVKELVENSLDAGASRIDVAVEDGGRQLIRVGDDGRGIPAEELPLAVAPHATSKLRTAEDLAAIATLGFRGEALASVASVSRLRLTSRAMIDGRAAEAGATLEASGDAVGAIEPAACAPGSVIEVRDLFFNTPARRKFMRSAPSEFGHIVETVARIAMVRPDVAFSLAHNGRTTLETAATPDRRRRCVELLGAELDEALLEFEAELPRVLGEAEAASHGRVWGLAGVPSIARASGKFQYLCLNGRPIRDRNLLHAVREAYRGLIPPDRQPVTVVCLELDPASVDVNVHPTKAEVRFRDPSRVHGLVLTSIRQRLLGSDLTPHASLATAAARLDAAEGSPGTAAAGIGGFADAGAWGEASKTATGGRGFLQRDEGGHLTSPFSPQAFVDYFRRMDPQQKTMVYEQVRAAAADDGVAVDEPPPADASDAPAESAALVPPLLRSQGVLQVHQSYLVTQDEQGLLIVDQHALHERVMFEELRRRIGERNLESQRLLMPAVVQASPRRQALLEQVRPLLERIGIEAEPFGKGAVAVHAFPSFLFERGVEPGPFLDDLLDRAEEGKLELGDPRAEEPVLHEVLDMMACKAAVKAGDRMSPGELASLLARREEIERASNCPHGRPTAIRLTLRDLEKQFKRA